MENDCCLSTVIFTIFNLHRNRMFLKNKNDKSTKQQDVEVEQK
jgi:hypothetical protein